MTDYELLHTSWTEDDDGRDRITVVDMRHKPGTVLLDLPLADAQALGIDLIAAAREAWMSGES